MPHRQIVGLSMQLPNGHRHVASLHPVPQAQVSSVYWWQCSVSNRHGKTVTGPLKPSARFATTRRLNEPFCTSGTFGSITSIEYGAASPTAMAVRSV